MAWALVFFLLFYWKMSCNIILFVSWENFFITGQPKSWGVTKFPKILKTKINWDWLQKKIIYIFQFILIYFLWVLYIYFFISYWKLNAIIALYILFHLVNTTFFHLLQWHFTRHKLIENFYFLAIINSVFL